MSKFRWALAVVMVLGVCGGVASYLYLNRKPPEPPPVVVQPAPPPPPKPAGPPPFRPDVYEPMSVRNQSARVPVIMYHDVIKKRGKGSVYFDCTVAELKQHIDYIVAHNAHPISLAALHEHLVRGTPVPDNAVVLTFDDNYQGFFDNGYPLLKEHGYPCAMFVHTNYVGDKTGDHPKMDWETLQKLDKEGLVTIAAHTLSHPEDLTKLTPEKQTEELKDSKAVLEQHLGHPIPYFAYPVGKNDKTTREIAQQVGYTMAFTMVNGPVEESPGILQLNRYIQTKFEKAFEDAESARVNGPAAVFEMDIKPSPVRLVVKNFGGFELGASGTGGIKLGLIMGGIPTTRRSGKRQSVGEFVRDGGGVAGINGSFFADARLIGTDATMIGPCETSNDNRFDPDLAEDRLPRLVNRPVVIFSPKKVMIIPFQPGYMNSEEPYKAAMPDLTDIFLAGAWIVHDGVARTEEQLTPYAAGDFNEPRRRAFLGITAEGEMVAGGTLEVVTTIKMAEAAAAAGVKEAVLLDSGFSTSIIYDNKIIVTGHTATNIPSRPIPHAIVLSGTLERPTEPEVVALLTAADTAIAPAGSVTDGEVDEVKPRRRRKRTRRAASHVKKKDGGGGVQPAATPDTSETPISIPKP